MGLTIAVIGSVMLDVTVRTPRLPASGENLYVDDLVVGAGGKGANAAATLARHGARVYLISNVGVDPWGEQVLRRLAEFGIETGGVGRDERVTTGTVVMLAEASGETCYLAYPGASRTLTPAQVETQLEPLLSQLDALLFNFEAPPAALQAAARLARKEQIPFFVDAGPERGYGPAVWEGARILSPNATETRAIVDVAVTDEASARVAAGALQAVGAEAVVIKLGARGAFWANDQDAALAPAFPIDAIDAAGAGDAFTAGLVWATLQAAPLDAAVRWASACGALVASRLGTIAAMPSVDEVTAFLAQHQH
jgi:ribokinase